MRLLAILMLACTCAATAHAQIFPRIEKDDVKKRVASGASQPDEPAPTPDEKPADVDGAAALKRYRELLAGYLKDEKAERKSMTRHTDELHVGVRDYCEGIFLLRMGFYKDAERKLKDVGISVRNEKEISTPELLKLAEEIKAGKAYFYRMIAVVMLKFDDFKNEKEAEAACNDALSDGIKIRHELELLVDRGKVTGDDFTNEMTAWMLTARTEWMNLFRIEDNVEAHPENMNTWTQLVQATGTKQADKVEYTPNFLKQRAALTVIKEFWPEGGLVKTGIIDGGLAQNHMQVGQIDEVDACLEKQPYHNALGVGYLAKLRDVFAEYKKTIEALKNK